MPDISSSPPASTTSERSFWQILCLFLRDSFANVVIFFCIAGCALLCNFAVRLSEYMGIDHFASAILKGAATVLLLGDVLVLCAREVWLVRRVFKELWP